MVLIVTGIVMMKILQLKSDSWKLEVSFWLTWKCGNTRPILGLCPANKRRRYKVTPSLIGWAQALNKSWISDLSKAKSVVLSGITKRQWVNQMKQIVGQHISFSKIVPLSKPFDEHSKHLTFNTLVIISWVINKMLHKCVHKGTVKIGL